jgi:O-antigen/teichoic acid export membrane protein
MTGVLTGMAVSMLVAAWFSRQIWLGEGKGFQWKAWLGRAVPLTLGLGAGQFMLSADMIVVRGLFSQEGGTGLYAAAGMIGRALVFFTIPLTAVMFPKIARSAARAEKTDVLMYALGATAALGGSAALFCTLFPKLPLWVVYGPSFYEIAPLVPWFAWCMLPLTLANLLISNLMARERYSAVPWLVLVAAGYGCSLLGLGNVYVEAGKGAFKLVVQTLGVFSLLLLAVAAWFSWRKEKPSLAAAADPTAVSGAV